MARSFDSGHGVSAAPMALAREATAAPSPRLPEEDSGTRPVQSRFRVGPGHIYMANAFKDGPGKAYRGEVQKILQTLRWDPIDGHLFVIAARCRPGAIDSADSRAPAAGRLGLGPGVSSWLSRAGLDQELRDISSSGLSLLERCACIALDPGSDETARRALAALEARRARGELAVYAGSARFYWRKSYHLALPGTIGVGGPSEPTDAWHAEGGQYEAAAPVYDGPVWRRRPLRSAGRVSSIMAAEIGEGGSENARPADSFDPRPAYLFDGLEEDPADRVDLEVPPAGSSRGIRFQPFVLRVGRLMSWPPNPLLRSSPEAVRPGTTGVLDQGGLAAWYQSCPGALTMRWLVSPRLDEQGAS